MIVAFDVETIPNPASEREDAALVPPLAVPISCAFYSENENGPMELAWTEDYSPLSFAQNVADFFDEMREGVLLSFNGRSYDIPVLVHFFAGQEMKIPSILKQAFRQKRWQYRPHVDLREAFCGSGLYNQGTLHDYCIAYGVESPKKSCDGSKVSELYAAGKFQEIAEYNLSDAIATYKLYEKWIDAWKGQS
jgi:predicted PolB exonuclease-like 3'-5' exonuclease